MKQVIGIVFGAAFLGAACVSPVAASDWSNAVDVCQGSLPSFEGKLRKRPLGMANEGATTAFITCSMRADLSEDGLIDSVVVFFTNQASAARDVSCTLVEGVTAAAGAAPPVFLPKALSLPGGGAGANLAWVLSDNEGAQYVAPNLNCALPPRIEINFVRLNT